MSAHRRHHHGDEVPPWDDMQRKLDFVIENLRSIMIDTSKILAEVARERTELASWKTMNAAKDKVIADQAAALAAAIAANDPAAIAKVQADLDQAANDLSADNAEAEAAIAANTPAAKS